MTQQRGRLVQILGFPLVCLALFVIAGGHWAALQAVAWTQMAVKYSQAEGSIASGLRKTFSGEFPCAMCKRIAAEKQKQEQKPTFLKVDKKTDGFLSASRPLVKAPVSREAGYPRPVDSFFSSRSDRPSAPVPIAA